MKYALVLVTDLNKKDWHCYLLANSIAEITNLNCFNPTIIKLPKVSYNGVIDPTPILKNSCVSGNISEFNIVKIENINLTGTFNLI